MKRKGVKQENELKKYKNLSTNSNFAKKDNVLKKLFGIKTKLILSFLITVCFIIILGVVSYLKSSKDIINNYVNSGKISLEMMAEYVELGMNTEKRNPFR